MGIFAEMSSAGTIFSVKACVETASNASCNSLTNCGKRSIVAKIRIFFVAYQGNSLHAANVR
jgi:hypothetical protein